MIKLKVNVVAQGDYYNIDIRYVPKGHFLVGGVFIPKVRAGDLAHEIYLHGRGMISSACDGDTELFFVSEAFFILDYELPVTITDEHYMAMKMANRLRSKVEQTWAH